MRFLLIKSQNLSFAYFLVVCEQRFDGWLSLKTLNVDRCLEPELKVSDVSLNDTESLCYLENDVKVSLLRLKAKIPNLSYLLKITIPNLAYIKYRTQTTIQKNHTHFCRFGNKKRRTDDNPALVSIVLGFSGLFLIKDILKNIMKNYQ